MDDRITAILARLRGGVAEIYVQKKLNEFDEENDTQDWDEFVKEFKTTFSDKSKAADAEWKIETSKQGKRNTADFMIEFKVLAMKADTDELHAIFLLKKNETQSRSQLEERNHQVHKMSRQLYNDTQRHTVQLQTDKGNSNRQNGTGQRRNWKGTR